MNSLILPGMLAICMLAGCQTFVQTPPPVPASQYGAASSVAVTRHAQYQLWDKGMFSATSTTSEGAGSIKANSDGLYFDWEGDAVELLENMARVRGLQFNYSGVRLPLPVTLHVRGMTFANVLRIIESQTAWRATLHQYPGLLQINFMQPEPGRT